MPELARDIATPDYCAATGELRAVNAWLGPAGTVTPLHTDPHHNLLTQAVGVKYVRLYPPAAAAVLCPFREGLTTNSSQVHCVLVLPCLSSHAGAFAVNQPRLSATVSIW